MALDYVADLHGGCQSHRRTARAPCRILRRHTQRVHRLHVPTGFVTPGNLMLATSHNEQGYPDTQTSAESRSRPALLIPRVKQSLLSKSHAAPEPSEWTRR